MLVIKNPQFIPNFYDTQELGHFDKGAIHKLRRQKRPTDHSSKDDVRRQRLTDHSPKDDVVLFTS